MPQLRPFKGIRYSSAEDLKDLVCPPYDVISPPEQRSLHERHPNNAVRVELPFSERPDEAEEERYRRAGRQFRRWLEDGVLVEDDSASMFVLRQDFRSAGGRRKTVAGVIGALGLEPWDGRGSVLPHERTMPGPVEDRLALLHACPANLSPIYAIYRGAGALAPFLDTLLDRPPLARVSDDQGTLHRMWAVRAPAEIEMLVAVIRGQPLVIADGHHRYETALAYHEERRGAPGQHDSVMCLCVDVDSQDVEVLPYHRLLRTSSEGIDAADGLKRLFDANDITGEDAGARLDRSGADHAFVFVLPEKDLLVELSREQAGGRGPGADVTDRLDVVVLHERVLPEVFPDGLQQVAFTSDRERAVTEVRAGRWSASVLLRALDPGIIIEVATSGSRMPQKASYFFPKALTGLVFRSLA